MRFSAFSFVIFAMLAATPAFATPPQVVSVEKTLVAIGGGFLFTERELNDNMGSHFLEQTNGPQQAIWAAYFTCQSEVAMAPVSMFITLQALL